MYLLWLFVQLVFWLAVCAVIVAGFLAVVLAPPYFAVRYLLRRRTA